MKIRMTKTVDGAPEGTTVHTFKAGTEHDLGHSERSRDLAKVFVHEQWAVEVGTPAHAAALKAEEDRQALFKKLDDRIAEEKAAQEARPTEVPTLPELPPAFEAPAPKGKKK